MASAYEDDPEELRIVLLGVSGVGKSSIGNAILGRDVFRETRTRKSEMQTGGEEDRNISIIDTPGFFNPQLTDEELQEQMIKSLFLSHPGPHVFLLIINLENFRNEKRNVVEKIMETFGWEALKFTMVLFIGREKVSKREWVDIIESNETKKILKHVKGGFHVINSKNECDSYQISKLVQSIHEIVKNNEEEHYSNEIFMKTQRKQRGEQNRMKKEKGMKSEAKKEQKKGTDSEEEMHTTSKKERNIKTNELTEETVKKEEEGDLRIVLLGKTGAGKSATGNTILGRNAFRFGFLTSTHSCEKQAAVVSGKTIAIIDTPGLLNSRWYKHNQDELEHDIEKCLTMSAPGPHFFVLVIKLSGSYTEKEKDTVKWIQENIGEDAVHHTVVLFTHADLLKDESLGQYIRKSPDLQSLIDSCGGRFHSFNNEDRNDQNQVTKLLVKIDEYIKDNRGKYYAIQKTTERKNRRQKNEPTEKEEDTRNSLPPTFLSPKEKQEQKSKINTQSKNEKDVEEKKDEKKDDEKDQNSTELQSNLQELHRETGQLLGLMMHLELSEMAMKMSLMKAVAESNLSKQGLRIVLLGLVASGKSSTGNTILRRNAFRVNPLLITEACEKQAAVVSGKPISVVDTPPIVLNPLWFIQQAKIEKSLEMSAPGPHVFLLVMEVEHLSEQGKLVVEWIRENIERDALNHTIVLFTHTDVLNKHVEDPLKVYLGMYTELKLLIISCGGRYHSISNKESGNLAQVIQLLMKMDELVQKNEGRHYTRQNIFRRGQKTKEKDDNCEIQ